MSDLLKDFAYTGPEIEPTEGDPLDSLWSEDQAARASVQLRQASDPEKTARANALSRQIGLPASIVEGNLPTFEAQVRAQKNAELIKQYPAIGRWSANPRNVAVAQDDYDNLGLIGKTLYGLNNFKKTLKAGTYTALGGIYGAIGGVAEVMAQLTPGVDLEREISGRSMFDVVSDYALGIQKADAQIADAERPDVDNWFAKNLLVGVESLPTTGAAIGVGLVGGPGLSATVMGGTVGGNEYARARAAGLSPQRSAVFGVSQGAVEFITEKIPASRLIGDIAKNSPFAKTFMRQLVAEIPGEQAATFLQDLNDWATLNPQKTLGEFLAERPEAAASTLVATVGGVGAVTLTARAAQRTTQAAAKVIDRVAAASQGTAEAKIIDQLGEAAAASKLKARDNEAYSSLVKMLGEDTGVESLIIPAESMNTYMQMDGYDGRLDAWIPDIEEGLATGGDVIIPIEQALTGLAGTPAWEALKGDMRLTPGGMSRNEAQNFEEAMADVMADLSDQMARQDESIRGLATSQDKLRQTITDKLMNAGFTPTIASQQAELLTTRYTTRAERLGRELTGDEFAVEVKQVLPERLAAVRKADQLDMTVAMMKRRVDPKAKRGRSLLEFIASRGGIEDRGGDLKAMGADKWHKGKPGRRKLVRERTGLQGSLASLGGRGGNENTADFLAGAAQEAGFFPPGARPDVNALLDAIAEELAGRPTFAEPEAEAGMREAAEELRALLENRGVDPEKATNQQIREAVDGYVAEQAEGLGYDQVDTSSAAFKAWFGDSKVVDGDGKPLVVYHGTNQPIENFNEERLGNATRSESSRHGFFFTSDPHVASLYADNAANRVVAGIDEFERKSAELQKKVDRLEREAQRTGKWDAYEAAMSEWEDLEIGATREEDAGQNVLPVYLSIQNPKVIDFDGETILKLQGGFGGAIAQAKAEGYDGLILRNIDDTPNESRVSDHYVTFDAAQIKSVYNRGTFDPADPRILYQAAYHGSPHIFDRFSLDRIGTGEGAQVFGYGLYFAGRREIAEFYRNTLSGRGVRRIAGTDILTYLEQSPEKMKEDAAALNIEPPQVEGISSENAPKMVASWGWTSYTRALNELRVEVGNDTTQILNRIADKYNALARKEGADRRDIFADKMTAAYARALAKSGTVTQDNPGRLYKADIPEDNEYLLWDRPLNEQPAKIRKSFDTALADIGSSVQEVADVVFDDGDAAKLTGEMIYKKMIDFIPDERSSIEKKYGDLAWDRTDKIASHILNEHGIAGIKYLDASGRNARSEDNVRADAEAEIASLEARRGLSNDATLDRRIADVRDQMERDIKTVRDATTFNYVVFDDSRVSIQSYEQTFADGPRGRITFPAAGFGQGSSVINLFKSQNLSTFLHESGHLWLEELRFDANDPDAPQQLKDDWAKVEVWFASQGHPVRAAPDVYLSQNADRVSLKDYVVTVKEQRAAVIAPDGAIYVLREGSGHNELNAALGKDARWFIPITSFSDEFAVRRPSEITARQDKALQALSARTKVVGAVVTEGGLFGSAPPESTIVQPPTFSSAIPVEAHELWARGVERYLMEGKAPTTALRKAFETFKGWLVSIYKTVGRLNAPITDEIRGVMDRLIATDQAIIEAAETQNIEALFDSAAQAGMSESEYAAYVETTKTARSSAHDALLAKVMASVKARVTAEYKEQRETVRAEVEAEVNARPEFKALRLLKATPIDSQWVRDTYGEDGPSLLPKQVPPVHKDNGANPDIVAELAGFRTGDEMVRALMGVAVRKGELMANEDKRSVRAAMIDQETDAIMNERYGDPFTDGSIEEEALALIHNDRQGEVMAAELRVLGRSTGKRATPYSIAKQWAANKVRSGQVRDMTSRSAIQRYERSASKSGKLALEAIIANDKDAAFRHKQAQMLNNALVAEAKKAADDIDKAVARLEKIATKKTIKSVDQDYLEQAQALLENVELRQRSQVSIDKQGKFEEWAAARTAEGHDIAVPPSFEASIGKTNWTRLTVENLLGLDDAVKQIIHLGRLKQTLIDNKEKREFEAVVGDALNGMGDMKRKPPSDMMEPGRWDSIKSRVASMDAALLKMETVFDWLDQGDSNGVFNRIVFRPIAEAQDAEKAMVTDYINRLTTLLQDIPKPVLKRWPDRVTAPELLNRETGNPFVFTRDQLVSMALNMGNTGNAAKLAGGYGWNEGAIMAVLNRELSVEEWQYVQKVWDTIDSLWPQIEALERDLNGVAPDKVEARTLDTSAGALRGGYYPVVYDPRRSLEAEQQASKASDLFENIYTRATTPKGFTKERTKVERPVHLSLGVINRHVAEVIHDITHRRAIMQADKFLADKRIAKAVDETLGPEVRAQFRPWLQHIANEWAIDRAGNSGWEKFLKNMRTNTTIVGMGFRITTMMMQLAGYSNSFERVGAKWVSQAIAQTAKNPVRSFDFVMERSGEVRNRMDTLDRDIRDNVKRTLGKVDPLSQVRKFAFHGIGYMDRMVVIPTWLGAYNRATVEGMSEQEAIYAADKAVRQSQGAGAAKDLAAIQRGTGKSGELLKYLTMFYSYMSAVYQRQRTLGRDIAGVKTAAELPSILARSWWLLVVPPLLAEVPNILLGHGPEDDEDWSLWAFEKMLMQAIGPVPVVRDVSKPLFDKVTGQKGFGYSFTPAQRGAETIVNAAGDVAKLAEGEETKRATRNVLESVGYATGLVPGQVATAVQFIVDVSSGDQDPETISDWIEGLTKGKVSED